MRGRGSMMEIAADKILEITRGRLNSVLANIQPSYYSEYKIGALMEELIKSADYAYNNFHPRSERYNMVWRHSILRLKKFYLYCIAKNPDTARLNPKEMTGGNDISLSPKIILMIILVLLIIIIFYQGNNKICPKYKKLLTAHRPLIN